MIQQSKYESEYDVIIIGTGAVGLTLALHLPENTRVALFSKNTLSAGSTYRAQGGVAAVLNPACDSIRVLVLIFWI